MTKNGTEVAINSVVLELMRQSRVIETNGLVNPLDDEAFEMLATLAEKYGGKHPDFQLICKRLVVNHNCKLYPDRDRATAVTDTQIARINIRNSQENDYDYLISLERKYNERFPKTLVALRKSFGI